MEEETQFFYTLYSAFQFSGLELARLHHSHHVSHPCPAVNIKNAMNCFSSSTFPHNCC